MGYKTDLGDPFAQLTQNDRHNPRRRLRLHDFPMWNNMTEADMERLLKVVTVRGYKRGDLLFDPSYEPDKMYLLQIGRVKTYVLTQDGRKKIMHIFSPGDAFGGLLLGTVDGQLPWAEAMEDVIICSMDELNFRSFMLSCPNMCLDLFRYISQIHVEAMRRLQGMIHTRADQRVVIALLDMGRRLGYDDQDEFTIYPYFTHEDIADMIGVVRTTVSEIISKLSKQGIVTRKGRQLHIHRAEAEAYLGK
ncbi:MAG: Crp/Fnr family transcriptional regulator [Chloroflexota bacterium]